MPLVNHSSNLGRFNGWYYIDDVENFCSVDQTFLNTIYFWEKVSGKQEVLLTVNGQNNDVHCYKSKQVVLDACRERLIAEHVRVQEQAMWCRTRSTYIYDKLALLRRIEGA